MCNCQSLANNSFGYCFCLHATSTPSSASHVESAAGTSTSMLDGHHQELPNMPSSMRLRDPSSPEVKLEVTSDSHEDAATTISTYSPSLFSKPTDAGPVADDRESVVPSIHAQFRQLAVGPVLPVLPPGALQAHSALMAGSQPSQTPADQSQSSLPGNGTPASDPTDVPPVSILTSATNTGSMVDAWLEQTMSILEHDSSFQDGFQQGNLHVGTTKASTGQLADGTEEDTAQTPSAEDDEGSDTSTLSSIKWSNPDGTFNRVEDDPDYIPDTDSDVSSGPVVYSNPDLNFNRVQDEEGYETDSDSVSSSSEEPSRDSEYSSGVILTHPDTPFHHAQAHGGYLSNRGLGEARDGNAERPLEEQARLEDRESLRERDVEDLRIGVLMDILGTLRGRVREGGLRRELAEAQEVWRFD